MKLVAVSLVCLVALVSVARAHFVYIVPDPGRPHHAMVVFSEKLQPDKVVPIDRLQDVRLSCQAVGAKTMPVKLKKEGNCYRFKLPSQGPVTVAGTCVFGVFRRGDADPVLLTYFPKLVTHVSAPSATWDELPLEIAPLGQGGFMVLSHGRPISDVTVSVLGPDGKARKVKVGRRGMFQVDTSAPGLYGIWARHIVEKPGQYQGEDYTAAHHYATLVFSIGRKTGSIGIDGE